MTYRFVFEARVRPGCTEADYIAAWEAGSAIIQQEPGALGTLLHRQAPGLLVAIATWTTKEARDAAMAKLRSRGTSAESRAVLERHHQFADRVPIYELEQVGAVARDEQARRS